MSQMSRSGLSRTLSKSSPVMVSAAWQGSTLPGGVMLMMPRPQPPMQGFGALGVIVGHDHVDDEHALQALALRSTMLDRLP